MDIHIYIYIYIYIYTYKHNTHICAVTCREAGCSSGSDAALLDQRAVLDRYHAGI